MAIEATRMEMPVRAPGYRWWSFRTNRIGAVLNIIVPAAEADIIRAAQQATDEAACAVSTAAAVAAAVAAQQAADEAACAASTAAAVAAQQAADEAACEASTAAAVAAQQAADEAACAAATAAAVAAQQAADEAACAAEIAAVRAEDAAALEAALLDASARVAGIVTLTSRTVRLLFDRVMLDNGALRDPSSYVLSAREGSTPRTIISVDVSSSCSLAQVELALSGEMTGGVANYMIDVAATLRAANGDLIHADPLLRTVTFDGLGEAPTLARAASSASDVERVRVTFSEPMLADEALSDPTNYIIAGDSVVTVVSVEVISPTDVDLIVTGQVPGGHYTLTTLNMRDLAGNLVS